MIQFKFLKRKKQGLVSKHGDLPPWTIGKWRHVKGKIVACANGFHASPTPAEAHRYVASNLLAIVEVKGDHHSPRAEGHSESAWEAMKVVSVRKIALRDYAAFIKFATEQFGFQRIHTITYAGNTLITTIKDCRAAEHHIRSTSKKGQKVKNIAAITQWWVDRTLSMPVINA